MWLSVGLAAALGGTSVLYLFMDGFAWHANAVLAAFGSGVWTMHAIVDWKKRRGADD